METTKRSNLPRFLVLVDPEQDSGGVNDLLAAVGEAASTPALFIDSSLWYIQRFPACGSIDSWLNEAVAGKEYRTHEPYFHGFVLAGKTAPGSAALRVAELAFAAGKTVYLYDGTKLTRVTSVAAINSNGDEDGNTM